MPKIDHPLSFILENKTVFFMGCFGGMAPILIQIANICHAALGPDCVLPSFTSFVFGMIAALILGVIGGVTVCAMKEKDYGKAIFLGVSAPALILSALTPSPLQRNAQSNTPPSKINATEAAGKKGAWNLNFFVTSAYAQNAPDKSVARNSNKVALAAGAMSVEVFSRNIDRVFNIAFYSSQNAELGVQEIAPAVKTLALVPPSSAYVRFKAGDSISDKFLLPQDASTVEDFTVKVVFQEEYSFLSFFTQTPKIVGRFEIQTMQRKKIAPGKEGWIYLGMCIGGRWQPDKRHTDLESDPVQAKGKIVSTAFENTHFRDQPSKSADADDSLVISLGQQVEILEVKQSDKVVNAWWAKVKVKS